jgi:hypothetical protein
MAHLGGDISPIHNLVDDGIGSVSFNVDVNGDFSGSTHDGTVTCAGPVRIVSEQRQDGAGAYTSQVNGDIYEWHTQCGNFAGVHYVIELAY